VIEAYVYSCKTCGRGGAGLLGDPPDPKQLDALLNKHYEHDIEICSDENCNRRHWPLHLNWTHQDMVSVIRD
jgi:hypothetical protein